MSEKIDNGGPAFPSPKRREQKFSGHAYVEEIPAREGMSIREYFAAQSLPGVIYTCRNDTLEAGESHEQMLARKAYSLADAMLAHRNKE